ncbi:MAG: UDP-N-acetylmuramate--L-alanine ligase [Clostridia bacterium]|nr:UDP-N-acetylmuramate--L-alanine ligase [Clostridia bacterium]
MKISNNFDINDYEHVHFIGIGGISMSGLAKILIKNNFKISGSDINHSPLTDALEKLGATIYIGHHADNIKDADLVVYTAAVKQDNPEIIKSKQLGIPLIDRACFLGQIMKKYSKSIAVAGTHGKTTTTSLLSIILQHAALDPTVLVGGQVDAIGGNVRTGNSQIFVTEACEYVESFLKFFPYIEILLNIDADHLDYFKDIDHITSSFMKFATLVPPSGYVLGFGDDKRVKSILEKLDCNTITFGFSNDNDWWCKNIECNDLGFYSFDAYNKNKFFGSFKLGIHGKHNVSNALACIAVADLFDIKPEIIREALENFNGTHRRFEIKGIKNEVTVIDDYAHHPSEVKATLKTAAEYPHNKIWCIFQPHTYTRTKKLIDEFAHAFYDADNIIITDIYAAREKDTGDIHAKDLVQKLNDSGKKAVYIKDFKKISSYITEKSSQGDIIITMGAGDIYKVGDYILKNPGD